MAATGPPPGRPDWGSGAPIRQLGHPGGAEEGALDGTPGLASGSGGAPALGHGPDERTPPVGWPACDLDADAATGTDLQAQRDRPVTTPTPGLVAAGDRVARQAAGDDACPAPPEGPDAPSPPEAPGGSPDPPEGPPGAPGIPPGPDVPVPPTPGVSGPEEPAGDDGDDDIVEEAPEGNEGGADPRSGRGTGSAPLALHQIPVDVEGDPDADPGVHLPPVAYMQVPQRVVAVGDEVIMDARLSYSPSGLDVVQYRFLLPDGTWTAWGAQAVQVFVAQAEGRQHVAVQVRDATGLPSTNQATTSLYVIGSGGVDLAGPMQAIPAPPAALTLLALAALTGVTRLPRRKS